MFNQIFPLHYEFRLIPDVSVFNLGEGIEVHVIYCNTESTKHKGLNKSAF